MKVDEWIKTNTYHHSSFSNISRLVGLKKKKNLTISLAFPTLNEEETIAEEINVIKGKLQIEYPLLDEIVVMDSDSTDRTRELAREAGAKVYLADDCLPEFGSISGKGGRNMMRTVRRTKINSLSSKHLDNWVKEHTKEIFKELGNGTTVTDILALAKIRKKLIAVLDAKGLDVFKRGRQEPERIKQALAAVLLKEVEAAPEAQRVNSTMVRFQKRENKE